MGKFLKTTTIEPYYILAGDNSLFKDEFIKEIKDALKPSLEESAIYTFDCSDKKSGKDAEEKEGITAGEIIEKASTNSFFSERNLVIVREFHKLLKADFEKLMNFIKKMPGFTNMVLLTPRGVKEITKKIEPYYKDDDSQKQKELKKELKERIINFSGKQGNDIKKWAVDYLFKFKKVIDSDVLNYVIAESNSDARQIKNELDKMMLVAGDKEGITKEDFNQTRGVDKEYDIWKLVDAISDNDENKAFTIFEKIYEMSEPEPIMGAIFSEIRNVYLVKFFVSQRRESDAMRALGGQSWKFKSYKYRLRYFKKIAYLELVSIMKDADTQIKHSSRENAKTIIYLMMGKIFLLLKSGK